MVIIATRKAEPVAFQVNSPVTSVSNQRTRNTTSSTATTAKMAVFQRPAANRESPASSP